MTTNSYSPAPVYTVSGIGPYDIPFEYASADELTVSVVVDDVAIALAGADYTVVPQGPTTSGTVFLTPAAAAIHDGKVLSIARDSNVEQTWVGLSSTAAGLEYQLDQMTRAIQETQIATERSLRVLGDEVFPYQPQDGRVPYWDSAIGSFANGLNYSDLLAGIDAANAASEGVDIALNAISGGKWRADVPTLLGDTALTYVAGQSGTVAEGDKIATQSEGFGYAVAASGASDHHVTTAGGVKLYVLPGTDGSYSTTAFGAVGDGVTDDTAAIETAISVAETAEKKLVFPRADYLFSAPLTISGIDVEFNKSILYYDGPTGVFALTLNSNAGASLDQRNGNRFSDLNLIQEDWSEYVTYSGSTTYDPPSLAAFASVTEIVPTFITTTVAVPGARAGGYVRVDFDQLADGCTVCGAVTADDEVTVYFNSYTATAVDMPSGTLTVDVVNNAYHGLCIGGNLGTLENAKVSGFTGISLGAGAGLCQITGVTFPALSETYYWDVDLNISAAAGFGLVCQPRNNENIFSVSFFGLNAYGDPIPRRAPYISMAILSGLNNTLNKVSLEGSCSEATLVLTDAAKNISGTAPIYFETNPSFAESPDPIVEARSQSVGCIVNLRAIGRTAGAIRDDGFANKIQIIPGAALNGGSVLAPRGGANLVFNGDFENGTNGWTLWGTGGVLSNIPDGYLSGRIARVDVTAGTPNLQQDLEDFDLNMAGLDGKVVTAGAWVRTNVANQIFLRLNGQSGVRVPGDEEWHFACVPARLGSGANALSIRADTTMTGYFEVCNVTAVIGDAPLPFGERTRPQGLAAYDPPTLANGQQVSTTVTVAGAVPGDFVLAVAHSRDLQGTELWAYISAPDTVTVVFRNETGASVNVGAGVLNVLVQKV